VHTGGLNSNAFVLRCLNDHGTCAIAKNYGYVAAAGAEIQPYGVYLGTDQQNLFGHAGLDVSVGSRQAVHETGTLGPDVERGDFGLGDAKLALQQHTGAGEVVIRAQRRENDKVDVFLIDARVGDGFEAGLEGQGGSRLFSGRDVAALFDAGPLANPFIAGLHHRGKILIGDHVLGHVMANSGNSTVRHNLTLDG